MLATGSVLLAIFEGALKLLNAYAEFARRADAKNAGKYELGAKVLTNALEGIRLAKQAEAEYAARVAVNNGRVPDDEFTTRD